MKNKLIKLLGGYPQEQVDALKRLSELEIMRKNRECMFEAKEKLVREIIRSKAKREIVVWEDYDARYQLTAKKIK